MEIDLKLCNFAAEKASLLGACPQQGVGIKVKNKPWHSLNYTPVKALKFFSHTSRGVCSWWVNSLILFLGKYRIVLDVRYLFLGIIWVSSSVSSWVSWVPSWVPLHHFSLPHLYLTLYLTLPILNLTLLHLNLTLLYLNLTFPILTSHCLILNLTLNLIFSILLFFFDH